MSVTFAGGAIVSNTSPRVSHRAAEVNKLISKNPIKTFLVTHSNWGAEDPRLPEFVAVT